VLFEHASCASSPVAPGILKPWLSATEPATVAVANCAAAAGIPSEQLKKSNERKDQTGSL
jgi:hypothetical protein